MTVIETMARAIAAEGGRNPEGLIGGIGSLADQPIWRLHVREVESAVKALKEAGFAIIKEPDKAALKDIEYDLETLDEHWPQVVTRLRKIIAMLEASPHAAKG